MFIKLALLYLDAIYSYRHKDLVNIDFTILQIFISLITIKASYNVKALYTYSTLEKINFSCYKKILACVFNLLKPTNYF